MYKRCPKCLLSAKVPGADLASDGTCRPCREFHTGRLEEQEAYRGKCEEDLEHALATCSGRGEYDCLVSFSGGKDSVFLLHKLVKEYGLKVLAYTSNFDIPQRTWKNIRQTTRLLDVDHIVYTPPQEFYRRFIRHLLLNQDARGAVHTVCYFWLDLREGDLLRLAVEKEIPLVLSGYSPGQPDPKRMLYEMSQERICEEDWTPHDMFTDGIFRESERHRFWNPKRYPCGTQFPRFLAPFHAWPYDQSEVMRRVVELGLVPNRIHANPMLSNFSLNWLLMYSDLRNLGYNPYLPEFAQLIREGKASLAKWRAMEALVNFMIRKRIFMGRHVNKALKWLDLSLDDLSFSKPIPKSVAPERQPPEPLSFPPIPTYEKITDIEFLV
ncbi:MAG: hypothetical protein JXM70_19110 [Pirellulales bacterium]|nr:hypothetical protein [Pirellulales bacterium]